MEKISVRVEGVSPLLMHRFRDSEIEGKSKKQTGANGDKDPADCLYTLPDGTPYLPAIYFRNALIEAAKDFKIRGKGKANYSKLVGCSVDIFPEALPITPSNWDTYRVAAVNPMTKGRMMVSRPRFNKWMVDFEVILNDDGLSSEVVNEILTQAGKYVGVGSWRPQKKGTFGKFMVIRYEKQ